jgi:hypothetical protein
VYSLTPEKENATPIKKMPFGRTTTQANDEKLFNFCKRMNGVFLKTRSYNTDNYIPYLLKLLEQ